MLGADDVLVNVLVGCHQKTVTKEDSLWSLVDGPATLGLGMGECPGGRQSRRRRRRRVAGVLQRKVSDGGVGRGGRGRA